MDERNKPDKETLELLAALIISDEILNEWEKDE
jgi:hypothetical protein